MSLHLNFMEMVKSYTLSWYFYEMNITVLERKGKCILHVGRMSEDAGQTTFSNDGHTNIYSISHALLKSDGDMPSLKDGIYVPSTWTWAGLCNCSGNHAVWHCCSVIKYNAAPNSPCKILVLNPGCHVMTNPRPCEDTLHGCYSQQPHQGPCITANINC